MAVTPFELPSTPFHRMRRLASLLLVAIVALFAAAHWASLHWPTSAIPGYVRAFAEASLVGGLADWFAVTALFRHPLGLPIPHTAIIPTNKDRIGDSLAAFLKDNFLTPAVMARRLEGFHVAAALATWLGAPRREAGAPAGRLRRALGGLALRFVAALDDTTVAQLLAVTVTDRLRTTPVAPAAGRFLASLVADGRHEALVERAVVAGLDLLDVHEDDIRAAVAERSGKWVPAFVDEKIAGGIVTAVRDRLLAMSDAATARARRDPAEVMAEFRARAAALEAGQVPVVAAVGLGRAHPDRVAITAWLTRLAADLQDADTPAATKFEAAKVDLLDSPATAGLFASLWDTAKAMIAASGRGESRAATDALALPLARRGRGARTACVALRRRTRRGDHREPRARRSARHARPARAGQRRGDLWLVDRPAGQRYRPRVGRGDGHRAAGGRGRARPPVYPDQRHGHRRPDRAGHPRRRTRAVDGPSRSQGFSTTLRNSSWFSLKFLYAIAPCSSGRRWVMTTRGSMRPASMCSSSGLR